MKFSKVRNVAPPNRANPTDAGMDFYVPRYDEQFLSDLKQKNQEEAGLTFTESAVFIPAGKKVLIPSGIHVDVPANHALIAFNKSGIASRKGLDILACVVDWGYQGEVHISVFNTTDEEVEILYGSKLVQFVLLPVNFEMPEEVAFDSLYTDNTTRGSGGFGSTGQ